MESILIVYVEGERQKWFSYKFCNVIHYLSFFYQASYAQINTVNVQMYKMIDLYVILAMPFNSFLVVVIYIIELPSFYFGNAT